MREKKQPTTPPEKSEPPIHVAQRMERRQFVKATAAGGLAASTLTTRDSQAATEDAPVTLAIMGLKRGAALAKRFAKLPGVRIGFLCDVDQQRITSLAEELKRAGQSEMETTTDFQEALSASNVDALVCAAPNHWHAPATILACRAGKHVYVEKPCSHNPWEGALMAQVATETSRVVQHGTQRRSSVGTQLAIKRLHDGAIGRVYLAKAWYHNIRGSIGTGKQITVPENLDYEQWQGPAARRPYVDNLVHYNWHWRWHWGNGELGNNGVHSLDLCRWGLGVDAPTRVVSSGGRYAFDDDQETPDTHTVAFEFEGERSIVWHGQSCNRHGTGFVTFYGTQGTLDLDMTGDFRIHDLRDRVTEKHEGSNQGDTEHLVNFLTAVRQSDPNQLNAPVTDGHLSALLCHLGNISQRVQRSLSVDATTGKIRDDEVAMKFWEREYHHDWRSKLNSPA